MANPKGNPQNLRPWGPNNPPPKSPGRPRKRPQSEAYDDWLRMEVPANKLAKFRADGIILKPGATNADVVALSMGQQAIRGNVQAAKEIRESVEGKATQRIELSRTEERAPEFVVIYATPIPGERIVEKVVKQIQAERVLEVEAAVVASQTDDEKE